MRPEPPPAIVMLAGDTETSWIVYNRLVQEFGPFPLLLEKRVSRLGLVRNRARKIGVFRTLSQVGFVLFMRPFLMWSTRKRARSICRSAGLEVSRPLSTFVRSIESVNGTACQDFLREANSRVVIVNGTRIITRATLTAIGAVFLNVHHGITPRYRGAHGGYWALYQNDLAHCGVTVHVVDETIDGGAIVATRAIAPEASDNFATYPLLQTAAALEPLADAARAVLEGRLVTKSLEGPSALWYHPGFFQYLLGRLRGVR